MLAFIPASEPESPYTVYFELDSISRIAFNVHYAVLGYGQNGVNESRHHIFAVFIRKDGFAIRVRVVKTNDFKIAAFEFAFDVVKI